MTSHLLAQADLDADRLRSFFSDGYRKAATLCQVSGDAARRRAALLHRGPRLRADRIRM
jgi:hypothetical protein